MSGEDRQILFSSLLLIYCLTVTQRSFVAAVLSAVVAFVMRLAVDLSVLLAD